MNEKAYKAMSISGGVSIAVGVIVIVVGIVTGVVSIVAGGNLLKKKKGLTF